MRLLQMSALASAKLVAHWVEQHLDDVTHNRAAGALLLPTGSTPLPLYAELRKRDTAGSLDLEAWRSFNLDEFWPSAAQNEASFRVFMQRELFGPLGLSSEKIGFLSDTIAETDLSSHCESYEQDIAAAGGIALAIIGVGMNGHLAFNEPGAEWGSRTRLVKLSSSTRERSGFPGGLDGPSRALTVGLATILDAKRIVVLAHGQAKSKALFEMMHGAPSLDCPATCLQEHPNVAVLADDDACALLP
ncbi:MAG: glucosamine-6-phosphate isomerase [Planctomycetota bacterium]|nr:MAG: glucosamine-6-phosphate isomerase [Planctomycetota bacterium]